MSQWEIRLESDHLKSGYGQKEIITDISFSLCAGEILALIGPNGTGKSTLIKSVAGQLKHMAGTVYLEGREMKELSLDETAKKMSFLLTDRQKMEWMSCREVVSAGRYPYTGRLGILTDQDREAVYRAMEKTGVLALADHPFDRISDGQKQRVLLARALCQEPEVLILDEPASHLDIRYQLELAEALRTLAGGERLAILVSMHELDLVRRCADRILCMKEGRIDRTGSVGEIFSGDYLEQLFDVPAGSLWNLKTEKPEKGPDPAGGPETGPDGRLNCYIQAEGKRMRCGYTTGTCAALAAQAGALRLLTGTRPQSVSLVTPGKVRVEVTPEQWEDGEGYALCGIRKDAGDDIDCTDGILICAKVCFSREAGIHILAGEGVGRVTKPGLDQPVGNAAINSVPRRMITEAVQEVCRMTDYTGGLDVTIWIPDGEKLAKKTFNPELGIEGGLSVLGTSGIVEPMSRRALRETIALQLGQWYEQGKRQVILVPGNYGMDYLREQGLYELGIPVVKCSNFIGDALDECAALGYRELLLAGHIGKLVKTAAGVMNTHSREADCRREVFCTWAAVCGASRETCRELTECASTDACIGILKKEKLLELVMEHILEAADGYVKRRIPDIRSGILMFSKEYGTLGMTETARQLTEAWRDLRPA